MAGTAPQDIATLTPRMVRIKIKQNKGWTYFETKYGCGREEVEKRIEDLFRYDKNEVCSKLNANEDRYQRDQERLRKRKGKEFIEYPDEVKQPVGGDILIGPKGQDLGDTREMFVGDTREMLVEDIQETPANALERLLAEAKRLSDEVIDLERRHKDELGAYRGCLGNLREIKADIEQIERTLLKKQEEFEETVKMADEYAKTMNDISAERRPKVEKLAGVRAEIEELLTVNIAVYDSGEISLLENPIDFTMNISGFEEQYTRLIDVPECSELRLKDVKILSRLLAIASHAEGRRIVLICDRPELEAAFLKLTASGE